MFLPARLQSLRVLALQISGSTRLAFLALAFGLVGSARAQAPLQEESRFLTQHDCFKGMLASYDDWMAFLREKNGPLAYLVIRWKFPEGDYNRYRRSLECYEVSYRSNGLVVNGWLVQPRHRAVNAHLPVIVYNRGGNRALGALTFADLFTHVFPLAERGYVVAASNYRGVIPVPGEKVSPDEFGGADVHDVTNLTRAVAALPQADRSNVFMIGQGRGSIMTFRALLDPRVPVRAVAIYSGLYDLHELLQRRPEFDGLFAELIPGYRARREVELDKRSVNRWLGQLPPRTGVLVIHGEEDDRSPADAAHAFAELERKRAALIRTIFYAGESHSLDGHIEEVHAETLAWFNRCRNPAPRRVPSRVAGN